MESSDTLPAYFKLDILMTDISMCITKIVQEFNCMNIPIDDNHTVFQRFCAKLEQFLFLGIKEKNVFGRKRSYWDYILKCLTANKGGVHDGLKFVKYNSELKTSLGRGRGFLRFCLVHQCLADTLQQCVMGASEVTTEWYAGWAPMRNEAAIKLLIESLYDLNNVQFDLSSPSCHDLDLSWPTFNRREFGSPYNWKAISRSGSVSSLSSSFSTAESTRLVGAMSSVQEGTEGHSASSTIDINDSVDCREDLLPSATEPEEQQWMNEEGSAAPSSWTGEEVSRGNLSSEVEELKKHEAWRRRERENEKRSSSEERQLELDMLRARLLELEVANKMAEWASVGVQASMGDMEDSDQTKKRIEAEERLLSVSQENEDLKKSLEEMRLTSGQELPENDVVDATCKTVKMQTLDVGDNDKIRPNNNYEENLRREYESQIRNIRELRVMYKDRMKASEEQIRKLREDLQEKNRRLELSRKRCSELRNHSRELETLLGEQEGVAHGLQARLSASLEEGRALAARLTTVNRLFGRLGDTAELDFERLRLLQRSCEGKTGDEQDGEAGKSEEGKEGCAEGGAEDGAEGGAKGGEEVGELKEIAISLPKVWRLLVELLGEEQKEEDKDKTTETDGGCFDSIPTPYGPKLVISVSRTFIRLKDLILEKKSLQNELGRIRDLNCRLESKLKQQERRLATVKVELKRTWGVVSRMRAQHRQLHTSEQVLRYELQQKRKLLGELKQELEYCREKWELARLKNSQSEKEWQVLRQEFTSRRSVNLTESNDVNSPESGFSDGRGEDEEEDEEEEKNVIATMEFFKCSEETQLNNEEEDCLIINTKMSESAFEGNAGETLDSVGLDEGNEVNNNTQESEITVDDTSSVMQTTLRDVPEQDSALNQTSDATIAEDCSSVTPSSSISSPSVEGTSTPETQVFTEKSMEERLQARAERLKRLEEQCNQLFRKVTRTTTRSAQLSSRLEELHEQYGDQQANNEHGRQGSADPETTETPPRTSPLNSFRSTDAVIQRPPTPPPFPNYIPPIRLPCTIHSHEPTSVNVIEPDVGVQSNSDESSIIPENSAVTTVREVGDHTQSITEASEPAPTLHTDAPSERGEGSHSAAEDLIPSEEEPISTLMNEELLASRLQGTETSESSLYLGNDSEESSNVDFEDEQDTLDEDNEEDSLAQIGDLNENERGDGRREEGESDERQMDDDAFIADMSSKIYDSHHGPLFDDGTSPSEEECFEEDIIEEDDIDEDDNEEGLSVTNGSIGVASLLLQQLPKRMDILRRERHSLEQRVEEGEAALSRALASTAAAERRARSLERGLMQTQDRLRVLEMEAAVERNERLLEIKSTLDANPITETHSINEAGVNHSNDRSTSLQYEIDNLQQKTLAQIAGLQTAAAVSRAQKEQLENLTEEMERQEKLIKCLETELSLLRKERGEQAEVLREKEERLREAIQLLAKKEIDEDLQNEQRQRDLDQYKEENKELSSRLVASESKVRKLNGEIDELKDDCDKLREVVIRLTGEKETLFRSNHQLEEMRRLVLCDSKWVSDKESGICTACGVTFSLMVRRHHCRSCGRIFCGACSSHWLTLSPEPTSSSLVGGVLETLMSVAGRRSRACADCFAAYHGGDDGNLKSEIASCSQGGTAGFTDGNAASGESAEADTLDVEAEEDEEDFSMISEEDVILSQCTPYVPNPRTLQYWKSCEIQSGITLTVADLLMACLPENGVPGKGKSEEVWIRAGTIYSVPLLIEDTQINIFWEFTTNPSSIAFSVLYKSAADLPMSSALIMVPTTRVNSHLNPIQGRIRPKRGGVYILMFDNSFSRFTGKTVSFCLRAETSGKGDTTPSSCRSSVDRFPDLPTHYEEPLQIDASNQEAPNDGAEGEREQ